MAARASERPRIRAAALMTVNDQVVVVRHRKGEAVYHLLPGGGVRYGETLEQALSREVLEETGLRCSVGRPLVINDTIAPDGSRHVLNITLACEVTGGGILTEPRDPRVETVELCDARALIDLDFRPPIAEHLVDALTSPGSFVARYVGSVFTSEQDENVDGVSHSEVT